MTDVFYNRFGFRQNRLELMYDLIDHYTNLLKLRYDPIILCRYMDTVKDIEIQLMYIDHEGE